MKLQMTESRYGSSTGRNLAFYEKGNVYDVAESLACDFLNRGYAVAVDVKKSEA